MMRYRRLDENWDYTFGQGASNYLTGVDAVAQAIHSRLLLLYREWWEDLEDGLPLFEKILGSHGGSSGVKAVDLILRQRITETDGVVSITNFASSFENRKYTFQANVETIYGKLYISSGEAF